jgi:hypothetical protein
VTFGAAKKEKKKRKEKKASLPMLDFSCAAATMHLPGENRQATLH